MATSGLHPMAKKAKDKTKHQVASLKSSKSSEADAARQHTAIAKQIEKTVRKMGEQQTIVQGALNRDNHSRLFALHSELLEDFDSRPALQWLPDGTSEHRESNLPSNKEMWAW